MDGKYTVEQIRVNLGYNQKQMSEVLEMCENSYRNKIKGKHPWKPKELAKAAKLGGLTMDQISF
jgi:hypothetical protein